MYEYPATIDRVVDGDTIDVNIDLGFSIILKKQRVRLLGIDAPESRTRDLVEKEKGLAAKAKVQEMCPEGSNIVIKTYLDKKGKYGRLLGEIIIDDVNLNNYLVEHGFATEYLSGRR
jgi:micrococcal nuclease